MMPTPDAAEKPKRKFAVIVVVLAMAAIIWALFIAVHPNEVRTNDAQVDGHILPLNARVSGTVLWVNPVVEDTRFVNAGTVLARLDPNDYQPTVDRLEGDVQASDAQLRTAILGVPITSATATSRLAAARAAVADAEADVRSAESQQSAADASVSQASASYKRAEDDRLRYETLVSTHEISRSEYDLRATEAKTTEALMVAAKASEKAAEERIVSAREKLTERRSDVQAAETAPQVVATAKSGVEHATGELKKSQAALTNAKLDLGYTNIVAPVDGIIGRKSIEAGQRVPSGQLLLTLAPPNDVWVIANFRETQLRHMQVGQTATIHVDSSGQDLSGTVESIGGATGSKYSVIAPENATGNYVKVVQRVPVRIRIATGVTGQRPLLPGMSVEVSVRVRE